MTPTCDDEDPYPLAGSSRDQFLRLHSSTSSLGRRNSSLKPQVTPVGEQRYPMTESIKARPSASQHGSEDVQRQAADSTRRTFEPMTLDENPPVNGEMEPTIDYVTGLRLVLLMAGLMLVFGRIFMLYSVKWSYLTAMILFELGSLLCGLAPNSATLIVGRAIAGFGSAGILIGSFIIVTMAVPLQKRPVFTSVVGLMFGVGASVGPLLGGVFTDLVTWRWCFYINLPLGGVTIICLILFFKPHQSNRDAGTFLDKFKDLDIVGNILILGAFIMLFLALEHTTRGFSWNHPLIIWLLAGCGITAIIFMVWQWAKGDAALIPPRIIKQRTVAASCGTAFMIYAILINMTFFLPIWFQAVKNDTAMRSGVHMVPFFVTQSAFSLIAGGIVSKTGYATPPAVIGSAIGTVGLGLLTLLRPGTGTAQWVGYEVLTSAGFGLSIQQCFTAVQTVLSEEDVALGTAAVSAAQSLGGAIFVSVGNSVFQHQLLKAADANLLPGVDIKQVIEAGATAFRDLISAEQLPAMIRVYNKAIQAALIIPIPLGILATLIACFIEFRSVKKPIRTNEESGTCSTELSDQRPGTSA
ncbi:major facilitator superfamily-domain-containing protein [Neurospora hispaniola]|uniref:Major facilitator superfamily-domain-containing protein n=1 Tax=Neurospora hispaniola TaxID=588809 RepID=A0AAJ0MPA8_9PEZI|nr:major facilitator superfamily-domain-containing protein [Neurospora hispaniola]